MQPLAPTNVQLAHGVLAGTGPHAHFDFYKNHLNIWRVRSLRNQAELNWMNDKLGVSEAWTYVANPDDDPHPRRQDAAKFTMLPRAWVRDRTSYPDGPFKYYSPRLLQEIGASGNEGTGNERNLKVGLGPIVCADHTSMTIVHEMWWDESWKTKMKSTTNAFKCNFIWAGSPGGGTSPYLCEHGNPGIANLSLGQVSVYRPQLGGNTPPAPGRKSKDPYNPTGQGALDLNTFAWPANEWMRVFQHYEFNVPAYQFTEWAEEYNVDMNLPGVVFDAVSIWGRRETGELVRAYYRVPVSRTATILKEWRWAFDFSGNNLAGSEKHRIDLGDIGEGHSFTITVSSYTNARLGFTTTEQTTVPIAYAADMTSAIASALNNDAFTAVDRVSVKKENDTAQVYSILYSGSWSNQTPIPPVTINATGFIPGAVTRLQVGKPAHSIQEPLYAYARNFECFLDLPFPNEADPFFFGAPSGGEGRV